MPEGERHLVVDELFDLSLGGRGVIVEWGAVGAAARLALGRQDWLAGLSAESVERLRFAEMTASRHAGNIAPADPPSGAWLGTLPGGGLREEVAAHLVQNAADTGRPDPEEAEQIAATWLVRGASAMPVHLKIQGALARLHAVRGRLREALELQVEVARGFVARALPREASFALCEWLRLSGVLAHESPEDARESFRPADELRADLDRRGAILPGSRPYVALARARALLATAMDEGQRSAARQALEELAGDHGCPDHVRWSAARLAAKARLPEAAQSTPRILDEILRAAESSDFGGGPQPRRAAARRFRELWNLDRSLAVGEGHEAEAAVSRLTELEPGLMKLLRSGLVSAADAPAEVARLYPY